MVTRLPIRMILHSVGTRCSFNPPQRLNFLQQAFRVPATVGQAIAMLAALIWQSSEIQKILAFDGIFEELFLVVTREGGLESQSMVPQDFVLQFWNEDKATNAGLILEAIGLLLGPKGAGLREGYTFTRLLIKIALSSNALTTLKVKCLRLRGWLMQDGIAWGSLIVRTAWGMEVAPG
ncbi:hypothetical protein BJV77DRAFT_963542 [Russula vinacea]|nr:hypothetical protein BJV77DRAFT_963542 [Russula vinacea]